MDSQSLSALILKFLLVLGCWFGPEWLMDPLPKWSFSLVETDLTSQDGAEFGETGERGWAARMRTARNEPRLSKAHF